MPPTSLEEMKAAMSGAAPPSNPPPSDPPEGEDPPNDLPPAAGGEDDSAVTPPAGDTPADGDTPPVGDPPAAPQLDEQGRARGPDGKFVAAQPADKPPAAKPDAAAATPPVTPPAPATPPDHINDPIPPTLRAQTRERMQFLVDTVKERDTQVAEVRENFELVMEPIRQANASVVQFRESMNLLRLINSPDLQEQQQALQILNGLSAQVAERTGQVPPGMDPLTGHQDLLQAVNANQITRQYAEEVARSRRSTNAMQRNQQEGQLRQQQEQQRQQLEAQGQQAVKEVEDSFKALDPLYSQKIAAMRADPRNAASIRALHPSQWPAKFAQIYRAIKIQAAPPPAPRAAAPAAPAAPATPQPLRGKMPAGNAARQPANSLEAVTAAIRAVR